jgi:twitching motility two-component system response regulator PilH
LARKILLADDSVTAQNMGRKILADAGYEVITVNNGSAALKKISEQRPDLIVLDVYMPGYSGLEVCQRLKETGETARIPVLLTVGKLEPFKPEEAKRARADAFIVKPFEASELLSALTKLEDKIVPRSEGSKPGRFARSIAAIEEGRYDKTAGPEENGGWKNRINFPSGKKKAAEQENGDDPAIYNPVNKDLRTVVQSRTESSPESSASDTRVDLTALAPPGLPKDITPEEIAALAAAAAQIQGGGADNKAGDPSTAVPAVAEAEKVGIKPEPKLEPQEMSAPFTAPNEPNLKLAEEAKESNEVPAFRPAEILASIPSFESTGANAATSSNSSIVASSIAAAMQETSVPASDEPVTMALAAGLETLQRSRRWSAVAMVLSPEEAAISLESEMQKAFAAFAAAEGASVVSNCDSFATAQSAIVPTATVSSTTIAETEPSSLPATELAAKEHVSETPSTSEQSASATSMPEVSQTAVSEALAAVASAATEAIGTASVEFKGATPTQIGQGATPSFPESSHAEASAPAHHAAALDPRPFDAVAEAVPQSGNTPSEEEKSREGVSQTPKAEENLPALTQSLPEEAVTANVKDFEVAAPTSMNDGSLEVARTGEIHTVETSTHSHSAHEGRDEMAKKESEIAESTAAAWASWRRIRETGNSDDLAESGGDTPKPEFPSLPEDRVAMAVAAGAERSPEEILQSAESDPEIANIVDSVLADLRPKIVEEISRKLGKKK